MKKIEIYTARYCGTCRGLKKRLIKLKDYLSEVEIVFHDIDVERNKAKKKQIENIPTLIYYLEAQEISRLDGYISEEDILGLINGVK